MKFLIIKLFKPIQREILTRMFYNTWSNVNVIKNWIDDNGEYGTYCSVLTNLEGQVDLNEELLSMPEIRRIYYFQGEKLSFIWDELQHFWENIYT